MLPHTVDASPHSSCNGKASRESVLMVWLAHPPDLNCIENLWGLLKQRLYANNKQYSSKPDLKVAIERKLRDVEDYEESTIMKLTS